MWKTLIIAQIAVIGPNLKSPFFCGGGSASLRPYRSVSVIDALEEQLQKPVDSAEVCHIYNMLPVMGDLITAPNSGKKGCFQMEIYNKPTTSQSRTRIESLELDDTNIVLYDYSHPEALDNIIYATIEADLVVKHADKYAFGVTVAGTANLFLDDILVVSNAENQTRGESFFGSGSIEEIEYVDLQAHKVYRLRLEFGSAATSDLNKAGAPVFGAGGVRFGCARCSDETLEIENAVNLAKTTEQVVICVGLGPEWESEGSDRVSYDLPGRQSELISRICAVNANVVVVIQSGTPVAGPWDEAPAILQAWYSGNEGGHGLADIILGRRNPGGKLPLSWPRRIEDNPAFLSFRSEAGRCFYNEGVYVGYRFYETTKREVQWPFGHGLSYTSFQLEHLELNIEGYDVNGQLNINVVVTNISTPKQMDGSEVIQVYVRRTSNSGFSRPVKELKGFKKVSLSAGQTELAHLVIPLKYATSIWDETSGSWLMEKGSFQVLIGNSSASTPLVADFVVPNSIYWKGL